MLTLEALPCPSLHPPFGHAIHVPTRGHANKHGGDL